MAYVYAGFGTTIGVKLVAQAHEENLMCMNIS